MKRTLTSIRPLAAAAVLLLALPLVSLVVLAPWGAVGSRLADPVVLAAIGVSLLTTTMATAVVAVVGVPLGWLLARDRRWRPVRPLVLVPLVLPPVVVGLALQEAWGRSGLVGGVLAEGFGVVITFTTASVVLAQVFVALPLCVLAVESGVRGVDPRMEELGRVYGMGGWRMYRRVTLPLAAPGIAAGLLLAWARALGEFGATLVFAGNLQGRTQTVPLATYLALQTDPAAATTMSLLMLVVSVGVMVALRDRLGLRT